MPRSSTRHQVRAKLRDPEAAERARDFISGLGGSGNIVKVEAAAETRLRVVVRDPSAVDEAALKTAGIAATVAVGDETLHPIAGPNADQYAAEMRGQLVAALEPVYWCGITPLVTHRRAAVAGRHHRWDQRRSATEWMWPARVASPDATGSCGRAVAGRVPRGEQRPFLPPRRRTGSATGTPGNNARSFACDAR